MMRSHRTFVLTIVMCAGAVACRPPAGRERRDFERMRVQQRYDLFERSAFFPNGAVAQAPPAHTVPRDLAAQTPAGAPTLAAGAHQFAISCAPCHGAGGFGGGPIAPNLVAKRPPSLRSAAVAALPPETILAIITNGVGVMPPYGWQMPVECRSDVVEYVRALANMPATAATRADSTMADYLRRIDSLRAPGARADTTTAPRNAAPKSGASAR